MITLLRLTSGKVYNNGWNKLEYFKYYIPVVTLNSASTTLLLQLSSSLLWSNLEGNCYLLPLGDL